MAKAKKKSRSTAKKKATNKQSRKKEVTPAEAYGVEKGEPVHLDSTMARSDEDALIGHFAQVVSGEHKGRYGVFDKVSTFAKDGYPETVILVTRDEHNEPLVVNHSDLRPAKAGYRGSF